MNWKDFQVLATETMSQYYDTSLSEKEILGFPKIFDMVSDDEQIIGDAKYLTLVRGAFATCKIHGNCRPHVAPGEIACRA